jgi:hypothetical protein
LQKLPTVDIYGRFACGMNLCFRPKKGIVNEDIAPPSILFQTPASNTLAIH